MTKGSHGASDEQRFTVIQAGGIAAIICMLGLLVSSVLQGDWANAPFVSRKESALVASTRRVISGSPGAAHVVVTSPRGASAGSRRSTVSAVAARHSAAAITNRVVNSTRRQGVTTAVTRQADVGVGPAKPRTQTAPAAQVAAARTVRLAAIARPDQAPSSEPSVAAGPVASATDPGTVVTSNALVRAADSSAGNPLVPAADSAGNSDPTSGSTSPDPTTFTTSPPGVTADTFTSIRTGPGGYDVNAQLDQDFAGKLVLETNTLIHNDLTNKSNAFGVGGYQFPADAPFGAQNPLFTGQTYGPTWYAGSGTPEPPPSQWAIDPITGLPHDPQTGSSIGPAEWATSAWNPDSPSYDPGLYTAAGQTPPR